MTSIPAFDPGSALEADDDVPLFLKSFSKLFHGFCNPHAAAHLEDDDDSWDSSRLREIMAKDWASIEQEAKSSVRSLSSFEHRITSLLSPQASDTIKIINSVNKGTPETTNSTVFEELASPESDNDSTASKETVETLAYSDDTASVTPPVESAFRIADTGNVEVVLSPLASPHLDEVDVTMPTSKFSFEHEDTNTSEAEREAEIEEVIYHINNEFVQELSEDEASKLDAKIDAILEGSEDDVLASIHSSIEDNDPGDECNDTKVNDENDEQVDNQFEIQPCEVETDADDDDDESDLESLPDFTEEISDEVFSPTRVLFPSKFGVVPMEVNAKPQVQYSKLSQSSIKRVLIVTPFIQLSTMAS